MKGILLAGGIGSRLYPSTKVLSKQLLPIFDKPMIYYPLATLMLAGVRDVLVITTLEDRTRFEELLEDGSSLGITISYQVQRKPLGIAEAILLGESFIQQESFALILGDNFFYGDLLQAILQKASKLTNGALIFAYHVQNPERYGVVQLDLSGKVLGVKEKPTNFYSNYAIPGLYFYDTKAISFAKKIVPSTRGELEITDIHRCYLENEELFCYKLEKGFAWLDAGTPSSLMEASFFVKTMQERQGIMIGCIEEVAYQMGYIGESMLEKHAEKHPNTYGKYLRSLLKMQPA